MPNYLGGGTNYVQAGNNSGGGFNRLAMFGISGMQMKMGHMMRRDLISAQGEEARKTITHKTEEGMRADIARGFISRQHLVDDYDTIFAKDENGNYTREEMASHFLKGGLVRNAHGIQAGPIAGIDIANINAGRDANAPSGGKGNKNTGKKNNGGTPKPKKPKFGDDDFGGYTPRKTGTGGYDEAYKSGAIDKETYDSYVEDAASGPKDYMPKQASNAIDQLVKERDSRKDNLNDGMGDGNK